MNKYAKNTKLLLMPGRIYRINQGIIIKRIPVNSGSGYTNFNVYVQGNYFRSDNKEYLALSYSELEEVYTDEVPSKELAKELVKLEELTEILSIPRRTPDCDLWEYKITAFYQWFRKWTGYYPDECMSQEKIGQFTGAARTTLSSKLSKLTREGNLKNNVN